MENESGWKSKQAADQYKKIIDFIVPGRKDILSTIARLATDFAGNTPLILDIGCGHGDVTAEILQYKPDARCILIDYSDEMLASCKEAFATNRNISFFQQDLNNGLPDSIKNMKFDAVVSCFSLHHIDFDKRVLLYTDIRNVLKDKSLFINGDMFKGESPQLSEWEFDNWISWMVLKFKENLNQIYSFDEIKNRQLESFKKMGDKPGTIWQMYDDFKKAGFNNVDCMFKIQNLAVLSAQKSE